jgi:hypothetical protein
MWFNGLEAGKAMTGVLNHDKENPYMARRAAVIAAGFAMATSFGLAGAGTASAALPALKIANGAIWTIEVFGGGCQQEKFNTTSHHFKGVNPMYVGTWSGGGKAISMVWAGVNDQGLTFGGSFVSSPKSYIGSFGGPLTGETGQLVKGAVASFGGANCLS